MIQMAINTNKMYKCRGCEKFHWSKLTD